MRTCLHKTSDTSAVCHIYPVFSFVPEITRYGSTDGKAPSPAQLCEYIIDTIASNHPMDHQTLLSCSLVCRDWLSRSRMHIFMEIAIQTPTECRRFLHTMKRKSHLRLLVHGLELRPKNNANVLMEMSEHLLAPRLSNLSTIAIRAPTDDVSHRSSLDYGRSALRSVADWFRGRPRDPEVSRTFVNLTRAPRWLGSRFCFVTTLKLYMIQFFELADFGSMLCAFPNLSTLHCLQVHWFRWHLSFDPFRESAMRNVTELYLRTSLTWLPGGAELLTSAPTSLRTLAFSAGLVSAHIDHDFAIQRLDLERFTDLVEVHLICPNGYGVHDWIPRFLAHISSPALRRIKLQFPFGGKYLPYHNVLDRLYCPRLDEVLSAPSFSNVREVIFEFNDATCHAWWWRAELSDRLPKLYRRDVIRVALNDGDMDVLSRVQSE
ncbi:hypothetical protein OBBRIDRAFT_179386 [Obba rivulosa]|uniref:F-box domain-containing protein n=1 Tax=Obba rivulosa TaxID=1052685 RepID=A0A8E2DR63_9APHY|nr:hypothetical protein OBBRIDRAFT_179386 [Obba rivulosa]